jgi:UDP-N-acetylmuramoyl-L-alanyl-D-glutamate--2,6-diaminopimelate ligase
LAQAEFLGADDILVAGCSCDSQRVTPGEVFVALKGTAHDGHQFVADAVARGAAGVVVQDPVALPGVPVCVVPDTGEAFGRICQALAGDPSRFLKTIGITGTSGKTTTSFLIASVLAAGGFQAGIMGTLGCCDGSDWWDTSWTTPPANLIARNLARMLANGCTHAVMEVSSHALAQSRVAGISFDAACVTNVRRDHLDYHQTMLGYRLSKSKLFRHLAPEGFAVINADDPTAAGYLNQIDGPVLTVGIRSAAELTGVMIEQHSSEQTFLLMAGSETMPVRTKMIGMHHVYNCLVAAAVGLAYGIDLRLVVRGLEAVEEVPGRLQRIECGQPFSVYVDFAHTPDALNAVLQTLREITRGRLICVFGAGGDRDRQKRPEMAQEVEAFADLAVITSDNPRSEKPSEIAADLAAGLRRPQQMKIILDRAEAIAWALANANSGDTVLIAGKGHETQQVIGSQSIPFDDREVARRWLYQHADEISLDAQN